MKTFFFGARLGTYFSNPQIIGLVVKKRCAKILFAQYRDLKEAYILTHNIRLIVTQTKDKGVVYTKLAQ